MRKSLAAASAAFVLTFGAFALLTHQTGIDWPQPPTGTGALAGSAGDPIDWP